MSEPEGQARMYVKVDWATFRELVGAAVDADTGTREYVERLLTEWAKRRRRRVAREQEAAA